MQIASANISTGAFQHELTQDLTSYRYARATVVYVQGRQHPVEIFYAKEPQPDYVDAALRTFYQIHSDPMPGDVLIFLAGKHPHALSISLITTFRPRGYRGIRGGDLALSALSTTK
jgi:HrpA-like RNA helicase